MIGNIDTGSIFCSYRASTDLDFESRLCLMPHFVETGRANANELP